MIDSQNNTHIFVVDVKNRPIAVMDVEQVLRQGLKHRSVYLMLRDKAGRHILRRRPSGHPVYPGRWDIAGTHHVPATSSSEDIALSRIPQSIQEAAILHVCSLPPSARTGNAFVELYAVVVNGADMARLMLDRTYLAVDLDEFNALASNHPTLFTPALMTIWSEKIAFAAIPG